jgi:Nucleoplasmin-like domain
MGGYHSLTVQPFNTYVQEEVERDMILTCASLTPSLREEKERTSLLMAIDGHQEVAVCTFIPGSMESKVLRFPIKRGSRIAISSEGSNDIDLLFHEMEDTAELEEECAAGRYVCLSVKEGEPVFLRERVPVKLINVSLGRGVEGREKTTLFLQGEEGDFPLASLIPGEQETATIDLVFREDEERCFFARGPNTVDVVGIRDSEGIGEEWEETLNFESDESSYVEEDSLEAENTVEDVLLRENEPEKNKEKGEGFKRKKDREVREKTENLRVISEGAGKMIGKKSHIKMTYKVSREKEVLEKGEGRAFKMRELEQHKYLSHVAEHIQGRKEKAELLLVLAPGQTPHSQEKELVYTLKIEEVVEKKRAEAG